MNREEATVEAKKRWGKFGRAWHGPFPGYEAGRRYYIVGVCNYGLGMALEGFAEAFERTRPEMDEAYAAALTPVIEHWTDEVALVRIKKAVLTITDAFPRASEDAAVHLIELLLAEQNRLRAEVK